MKFNGRRSTTTDRLELLCGPSSDYAEDGPQFQDVAVEGVPTEIFTIKCRGKTVYLVNLLIPFSEQGKGYGKRAVCALEAWAKLNGFEKIVLESIGDAVAFWEKQGWTAEGRASESDWTRMVKYRFDFRAPGQ